MLLVDTSVWIDYIRAIKTPAVTALDRLLVRKAAVALTKWIYLELLQGTRSQEAFAKLRGYLGSYPILSPTQGLDSFAEAADIYRRCRERGITPRSAGDCLIALIAIEHQIPLLQSNPDFERIAAVEPRLILVRLPGPTPSEPTVKQ